MPLQTGEYIIRNVEYNNLAHLPNNHDGTPVEASYGRRDPGEIVGVLPCSALYDTAFF